MRTRTQLSRVGKIAPMRQRAKRIVILCPLLLLVMIAGCAMLDTSMPRSDSTSASTRLDALLRDYSGRGPGAAVLVLRDGQVLAKRGYGLADLEAGTAITPDSHFRLASISKQFTAAAILLLAQEGKLNLDDPAAQWLPSLPPALREITLHQLLTHSAGVIDYEDLMPADTTEQEITDQDPDEQVHDADVLRLLEGENRRYFAPGSRYRYSNSGYALLALVVEQASGLRYPVFLRERIFTPLGMRSVAFESGLATVPDRVYGYSQREGGWTRTDQSSTSAVLGDGGIYASIEDLAKWDAALYDDRLLSDTMRRAAFTAHVRVTDETDVDGYGYGWRVRGEQRWHSGETIGFRNVIVRWPQERYTVVVLSNRNDPEPYSLALKIAALYR